MKASKTRMLTLYDSSWGSRTKENRVMPLPNLMMGIMTKNLIIITMSSVVILFINGFK